MYICVCTEINNSSSRTIAPAEENVLYTHIHTNKYVYVCVHIYIYIHIYISIPPKTIAPSPNRPAGSLGTLASAASCTLNMCDMTNSYV